MTSEGGGNMTGSVAPRKDIVKQMSFPALLVSSALSLVFCVGFYHMNPYLEKTREIQQRQIEQVEVVEIPPTRQEQQRVAPSRPQVPVEAEDDAEIEDITIEDTELMDEAEIAVPERLEEEVISTEEEAPMEFWMVEEQPQITQQAVPEYPEIARQAGIEGVVTVMIVIGTDGGVENVQILAGPAVFHEEAQRAAYRMRFTPARQNDRAVRVKVTQRIIFRLN